MNRSSKSTLTICIACALLVGIYLLFKTERQTPESEKDQEKRNESHSDPTVIAENPSNYPKARPRKVTKTHEIKFHSDSMPLAALKPNGNKIEFHIVDGYAVAYGDVLLGKPEGPMQSSTGMYDAPEPVSWEQVNIPYAISPELPHPERVEKTLTYLRQKTPLNFVPYSGQSDGIIFEPTHEHCLSYLGKIGGMQPIKLSSGCERQEILHEILHSLGFVHEQSRPDRDQFLEVNWNNIEDKYQDQFAIAPDSFVELIRHFPFDYHSVMLYRTDAFTIQDDLPNMHSKNTEQINPSKNGLSDGDIKRLNRIYRGYE